jgi:N-acetylglucosamine-6-phosphate deacetylase
LGAKILGIHLEGPFINPDDGPRGVHPKKFIIPPSIALFEKFQSLSKNSIRLITLAPEMDGALELIEIIKKESEDTIISIGHTNASRDLINEAVNSGAEAATHVGNGLASMINRHDNPLWAILADDRITGLFNTDGFHLPKDFIRVGLRSKGIGNFIVTSDMTHLSGLNPGSYNFKGTSVVLEPKGQLHVKNSKKLAGSGCTIMDCMNFMASFGEYNESELKMIGFKNALRLLNIKLDKEILENAPKINFKENKFFIED